MSDDAYTAAWLAEMWPVCRELSEEERVADRAAAEVRNEALSAAQIVTDQPVLRCRAS